MILLFHIVLPLLQCLAPLPGSAAGLPTRFSCLHLTVSKSNAFVRIIRILNAVKNVSMFSRGSILLKFELPAIELDRFDYNMAP